MLRFSSLARTITPPIVADCISSCLDRFRSNRIRFTGNFLTWSEALEDSAGYNDEEILSRVLDAATAVREGRAAYERDSVLFHEPEYVWPVVSCLNLAAASNHGRLNVVDYGGSLGSFYFQHRVFLERFDTFWTVVEQPHFVRVGTKDFTTDRLRFSATLPDLGCNESQSVLLLSSVLQYLPQPHKALQDLLALPWSMVILDRTAFVVGNSPDRLTVQTVPAAIYRARYPAWFFSESDFHRHFGNFELLATWTNSERFRISGATTIFKGMCYVGNSIEHESR